MMQKLLQLRPKVRKPTAHLNDLLGRLDFGHLRGVALDDAKDASALGVDGVTPLASVDDLVLAFAGVDGVPDAVVADVLDVDGPRVLLVVGGLVGLVVVVVFGFQGSRSASEAHRVGSHPLVEATRVERS